MKPLIKSSVRVVGALLLVALLASLAGGTWIAWQDRSYANALSQAHQRVDARNDAELAARIGQTSNYLCERRQGIPTTEVLTRVVHATDEVGIAAARRTSASVEKIDAPSRWANFQDLAVQRRQLLLEMAVAYDEANARAVMVASTSTPRTDMGVIEALANDTEYRTLALKAQALRDSIQNVEESMKKAAPDHHLSSGSIKRELRETTDEGSLRLGAMWETATLHRALPAESAPAPVPNEPSC